MSGERKLLVAVFAAALGLTASGARSQERPSLETTTQWLAGTINEHGNIQVFESKGLLVRIKTVYHNLSFSGCSVSWDEEGAVSVGPEINWQPGAWTHYAADLSTLTPKVAAELVDFESGFQREGVATQHALTVLYAVGLKSSTGALTINKTTSGATIAQKSAIWAFEDKEYSGRIAAALSDAISSCGGKPEPY